eukprot:RCo005450
MEYYTFAASGVPHPAAGHGHGFVPGFSAPTYTHPHPSYPGQPSAMAGTASGPAFVPMTHHPHVHVHAHPVPPPPPLYPGHPHLHTQGVQFVPVASTEPLHGGYAMPPHGVCPMHQPPAFVTPAVFMEYFVPVEVVMCETPHPHPYGPHPHHHHPHGMPYMTPPPAPAPQMDPQWERILAAAMAEAEAQGLPVAVLAELVGHPSLPPFPHPERNVELYYVLELPPGSGAEAVREAYKKLALVRHPDKTGDSGEAFQRLNNAHSVLSDPTAKAEYDRFRAEDQASRWTWVEAVGPVVGMDPATLDAQVQIFH